MPSLRNVNKGHCPRFYQIPLLDEGETNMKVTTVSASVRYSRAINTGEYKTIELSAERGHT